MANNYNGCNNNCEAVAGLQEKAANLGAYSDLINSWLNGPANGTVNIAGVNTPTLLKLVTDLRYRINQMPQSILEQGGGIKINPDGLLYIDFNSMPPALLYSLLQKIVLQNGGLAFNSDGKMFVDFENMPTDKFDNILETFRKGLRLPKWLTANKNFIVNKATGSDALEEGRGETADKPFKSIQACVNYLANNYNVGNFTATILVADGIYEESVILPDFSKQNGMIVLKSASGNRANCKIVSGAMTNAAVRSTGGNWLVQDFTIELAPELTGFSGFNSTFPYIASADGGYLTLTGNLYRFNPVGNPQALFVCYGLGALEGGDLRIGLSTNAATRIETGFTASENMNFYAFTAIGSLHFQGSNEDGAYANIELNAETTACANVLGGFINKQTTRKYRPTITNAKTVGKRYMVTDGGKVNVGGQDFFPGAQAGTVETSTYSWYK